MHFFEALCIVFYLIILNVVPSPTAASIAMSGAKAVAGVTDAVADMKIAESKDSTTFGAAGSLSPTRGGAAKAAAKEPQWSKESDYFD